MELAMFLEPQAGGSYDRLLELTLWAEQKGLAALARADHYLMGPKSADTTDALVSFGGLARDTSSVELVSLVSPITFRNPAVMAKSATTIDEMSGGRFSLGVGTGWMESEHQAFGLDLPPLKERFDRLEESLAVISTIFAGGGTFDGEYYSLDIDEVHPKASPNLKIVVGGSGKRKTPRLAGTYANEYNMFVTDQSTLAERLDVMATAAQAAGRDPSDIRISFAGPAFIYEDEAAHREALTRRGEKRDMTPNEYAAFLDDRAVPHGTAENTEAAIERMASWGVHRYYVQDLRPLDEIDLDDMDTLFTALGA
jgi:alkanesulfonate monooxygenase SsuD/methylene tetrahydromethanopterin reductase-like flavin-dependent oxidoreductase (luciferase family)